MIRIMLQSLCWIICLVREAKPGPVLSTLCTNGHHYIVYDFGNTSPGDNEATLDLIASDSSINTRLFNTTHGGGYTAERVYRGHLATIGSKEELDCLTPMILGSGYVFDQVGYHSRIRVSGARDYENVGPYLYHKCDCDEQDQQLPADDSRCNASTSIWDFQVYGLSGTGAVYLYQSWEPNRERYTVYLTLSLENTYPFLVEYTIVPTSSPTARPTAAPTEAPTPTPTAVPTQAPTKKPTSSPTALPTEAPTSRPTAVPTQAPTKEPTSIPTALPTQAPTTEPTSSPTAVPTHTPTTEPTSSPTAVPTHTPTTEPTSSPTAASTEAPTPGATLNPTPAPTEAAAIALTFSPTFQPSSDETGVSDWPVEEQPSDNQGVVITFCVSWSVIACAYTISQILEWREKRKLKSRMSKSSLPDIEMTYTIDYGRGENQINERSPAILLNQSGNHLQIIWAGLAILDVVVDCFFVYERFRVEGGNSNSIRLIPMLAFIFVALPVFLNFVCSMVFICIQFSFEEVHKWFSAHSVAATIIGLLAISNPEVMLLLSSRVFGSLHKNSVFNAPFGETSHQWLSIAGAIGNIFEDLPQIGLQLAVMSREGADTLTLLAIATSSTMLLFGIVRRCLMCTMFVRRREASFSPNFRFWTVTESSS